jgi:hypothetical protein
MAKPKRVRLSGKARARVIVAKDVIAQLGTSEMIAGDGCYVDVSTRGGKRLFKAKDVKDGLDVRDVLAKRAKSCTVCARGAIFISTIRKFDNLPVSERAVKSVGGYLNALAADHVAVMEYFETKQLLLIEAAYEGWDWKYDYVGRFKEKYPDRTDRLIAIMKNLIANGGTFKPGKRKSQEGRTHRVLTTAMSKDKTPSRRSARVQIAQDVLERLATGKFRAVIGTYVTTIVNGGEITCPLLKDDVGRDLRDVLFTRVTKCHVCVRGAMFLSAVLKFNQMPVTESLVMGSSGGLGSSAIRNERVSDFFDTEELALIEYFFEGWDPNEQRMGMVTLAIKRHREHILRFKRQHRTPKKRLEALMNHIIDNNGKFLPTKLAA